MKGGVIRTRLGFGAAAAALVWTGFMASSVPARAFDDKPSTFEPLLNAVGLGKDNEEKPNIDFRERPKLVVPKGADLPPPQDTKQTRAANWPQDAEATRRRAAKAAERAPRSIDFHANEALRNAELQQGRTNAAPTSPELCETRYNGVPDCGALTPVEKLKRVFSLGSNDSAELVKPGAEPEREYLTEPPKGYRAATRETKYQQGAPDKRYEAPTASDYARGVDPNRTSDQ